MSGERGPGSGMHESRGRSSAGSHRTAGDRHLCLRSPLRLLVLGISLTAVCLFFLGLAYPVNAGPATVVRSGPPVEPGASRRVALTFDDNFRPEYSIPLLRYLREQEVPATLFVTAMFVDRYPELTTEMAEGQAEGWFEIGDHSATHPFLTRLPYPELLTEVGAGNDAYERMTGLKPAPLLRPPYGAVNDAVLKVAGEKSFPYVVLWNLDTSDWTDISAEVIAARVISAAADGTIVLMHMSATHTWQAVPVIVEGLRALGYDLVTVGDLLRNGRTFVDVGSGAPGAGAIERLVDADIMSGYDEFRFGPTDPMTRAQVAKVAVLAGGLHTEEIDNLDTPSFTDVSRAYGVGGEPLHYPFDYIEEAVAAGLVNGVIRDDGVRVFLPGRQITRVQLAQIVARMARELKGYPAPSSDEVGASWGDVPAHAREDVALAAHLGLMNGYGEGRFDPYAPALRGHVAAVFSRFLDLPAHELSAPPELPVEDEA